MGTQRNMPCWVAKPCASVCVALVSPSPSSSSAVACDCIVRQARGCSRVQVGGAHTTRSQEKGIAMRLGPRATASGGRAPEVARDTVRRASEAMARVPARHPQNVGEAPRRPLSSQNARVRMQRRQYTQFGSKPWLCRLRRCTLLLRRWPGHHDSLRSHAIACETYCAHMFSRTAKSACSADLLGSGGASSHQFARDAWQALPRRSSSTSQAHGHADKILAWFHA
jgi:hypothetical protein